MCCVSYSLCVHFNLIAIAARTIDCVYICVYVLICDLAVQVRSIYSSWGPFTGRVCLYTPQAGEKGLRTKSCVTFIHAVLRMIAVAISGISALSVWYAAPELGQAHRGGGGVYRRCQPLG